MSIITDHACKGQTLVDRLKFWGATHPNKPAFIFWSSTGRRLVTRGDLLDLSSSFASRLAQRGIRPQDVVCNTLPNSLDRVVAEFGIQLSGAVSMNGQVLRSDGEDLIDNLIKADCSAIVLNPDQRSGALAVCKHAFDSYEMYENHVEIKSQRIPSLKSAFICRSSWFPNGFTESLHEEHMAYDGSTPQDTCTIFTTSGSTGYSKLVPITHEALLTYNYSVCKMINLQEGSKFLDIYPLGWLGGFPSFYLFSGCTHVALDESLGQVPEKYKFIWDVVCRENVKYGCVPVILEALNEQRSASQGQRASHRLSGILTGGQPVTKENVAVTGHIADSVTIVYGASEFGLATRINVDIKNLDSFQDNMAGHPYPGFKLKIVDKNLQSLPSMSTGEILVQSPTLMKGYIGSDSAKKEAFLPDRWFRTGDIGFLREDGCLFVEGRSSDAIMHGANIFYPTWLEQKLINCPGVKKAVIVPVPDKVLHHEICACVQLDDTADVHPTAEDIIEFCKQETIVDESSDLNVNPKYVIFLSDFPQTNTNKLNRRRLADMAKEKICNN